MDNENRLSMVTEMLHNGYIDLNPESGLCLTGREFQRLVAFLNCDLFIPRNGENEKV